MYLKKFRKLEVLNIAGNPFTKKESDYKIYIMCHLVHLKYLDYSFIDEAMRNLIKDDDKILKGDIMNQDAQLKKIEHEEEQEREKQESNKKLQVNIISDILSHLFI